MSDVGELPSSKVEEPAFNGYQLIGDSQFLRFSERLLNLKRQEKDGYSLLGLCVSGQRISHLLRRVRNGSENVSERIVLMIGTNDLLGGTIFEEMCDGFKKLLERLSQNAKKMILLTLPPVLKLEKNQDHWDRLKKFNEFIKEFHDDEKFFVGDAYAEFVIPKESPNVTAYLTNSKKSLESTSICDSDDLIGPANEDKMVLCQTESDNDKSSPSQSKTLEADGPQISSDLETNDKGCCPLVISAAATVEVPNTSSATMALALSGASISSADAATTPSCGSSKSFFGDAVPSVGSTTPQSAVGVATISSDSVTTHFADDAEMIPSNSTSFAIRTTPDGPVTYSDCAVTPSGSIQTPSGITATSNGATTLFDNAITLSDNAATLLDDASTLSDDTTKLAENVTSPSLGTVLPSGDAVTPICGALTPSDTMTSSGGMSLSGGSTMPPDEEILISDGITTTAGGEIPYSGGPAMLSEDGMSSSDNTVTPSGCTNTLFSSNSNSFTPPSNKERALKRKCVSFSSGRDSKSKRKRNSYPNGDSYQFKRKLFASRGKRHSYSSGDRYLNDSSELGSADEVEIENADKIRAEYFEKYYDSECRRPDLIHLNADGLCVIKRIIKHIIDAMGEEKSEV